MLLPAKCFICSGDDPSCKRCGGTGTIALGVDFAGPAWTRKCPDCGWTNGLYFPQPGTPEPVEGSIVDESPAMNFCMSCPRGPDGHYRTGHLIWTKLN